MSTFYATAINLIGRGVVKEIDLRKRSRIS